MASPRRRVFAALPGDRVTRIADECGLGAYDRTTRVHRSYDGRAFFNSIGCGLGALLLIVVAVVLGPGPPFTIVTAIAAVVLLLVVALEVPSIARVRRVGAGWAHLFDHGIVLERAAGDVLALPASTSSVDYVTWRESDDAGTTHRTSLILAPAGGGPVMVEARSRSEYPVLVEIAARYGLPSTPVAIDRVDPDVRAGHW